MALPRQILTYMLFLGLTLLGCQPSALSAEDEPTAATVVDMKGEVFYEDGQGEAKALELGQLLGEGDRVFTRKASSLHLVLADGSSISLGPWTDLTLKSHKKRKGKTTTLLMLFRGSLKAIVEKLTLGSSFEVHSHQAVAAVKGTQFSVEVGEDNALHSVAEGVVHVSDTQRKSHIKLKKHQRLQALKKRFGKIHKLNKAERNLMLDRWKFIRTVHKERHKHLKKHAKVRKKYLKRLKKRSELRRKMVRRYLNDKNFREKINEKRKKRFKKRGDKTLDRIKKRQNKRKDMRDRIQDRIRKRREND